MSSKPTLIACLLGLALAPPAAWAQDAAGVARGQSYAADYFAQFQPATALDMVQHLPGFNFDDGRSARAAAGAQGNVLVDGKRPASTLDSLSDTLGRIPAASVLRIEIINGGVPEGGAQEPASTANVVLKSSDIQTGSLRLASFVMPGGAPHPSAEIRYSMRQPGRSLDLALGRSSSPDLGQGQGHRTTWTAGRATPTETDIRTQGVGATQSLKLDYGQDLLGGQLRSDFAVLPSNFRFRGQQGATQVRNDHDALDVERGLDYTRALGQGTNLELKARHHRTDSLDLSRSTSDGDASRYWSSNATSTEQFVLGQLHWQPAQGLVIRGGLEHAVNDNVSHSVYQANDDGIAPPSSAAWVRQQRSEGQLSSAWQMNAATSVEAGWRLERWSLSQRSDTAGEREFSHAKPRLQLSWSPTSSVQMRLRLDREVSRLNVNDFVSSIGLLDKVVTAGNADLVPTKTWLTEGILAYRFWDKGAAELTYAHSRISDVTDRVPIRTVDAIYDASGNIGDGTADSVTGQLSVPTDQLAIQQGALKLATTWKTSRVTDPTTLSTRRMSGEQALSWKFEFAQELPRQKSAWGFAIDNGWASEGWQVAQRDASSGSGWVKAFVRFRPAAKTTLSLELNNLAGRSITYDRTHYTGDRSSGSVDLTEHTATRVPAFAVVSMRQEW